SPPEGARENQVIPSWVVRERC
ncbi:MAG: hypothetical protein FD137_2050, partial [Spirochaetes bacterium]